MTSGEEPLLCSEFGNRGLPICEKLNGPEGREPWWFERATTGAKGSCIPTAFKTVSTTGASIGCSGHFDRFIEETQWQQFRALKYEIEAMRRRPEIAGDVMTELTDCHWESNGLLDMRVQSAYFPYVFHTIMPDTVIVPHLERAAFWSGGDAAIPLCIAHGGAEALAPANLEVLFDWPQTIETPLIEAGSRPELGEASITLPMSTGMHAPRLVSSTRR